MLYLRNRQYKEKAYLKEFEKSKIWIPYNWNNNSRIYYKCPCCGYIIDDWHYPTNVEQITCKCGFEGRFG